MIRAGQLRAYDQYELDANLHYNYILKNEGETEEGMPVEEVSNSLVRK